MDCYNAFDLKLLHSLKGTRSKSCHGTGRDRILTACPVPPGTYRGTEKGLKKRSKISFDFTYVHTFWVMLQFFLNNITGFSTVIVLRQNHKGKNKEEPHVIYLVWWIYSYECATKILVFLCPHPQSLWGQLKKELLSFCLKVKLRVCNLIAVLVYSLHCK